MDSFRAYMLRKADENVKKNGDRLAESEKQIEWERFRSIIKPMYTNDTPRGGRPNTDEEVMMKLLVLRQWYGLSDPELERQALNRIDFQHFLGFPGNAPDYSTVWGFRERLAVTRAVFLKSVSRVSCSSCSKLTYLLWWDTTGDEKTITVNINLF